MTVLFKSDYETECESQVREYYKNQDIIFKKNPYIWLITTQREGEILNVGVLVQYPTSRYAEAPDFSVIVESRQKTSPIWFPLVDSYRYCTKQSGNSDSVAVT